MNELDAQGASDITVARLKTYGDSMCYAVPNGAVTRRSNASENVYYDTYSATGYTPWMVETGWLKTGQQARARFSRLLALLKNNAGSNHKMTLEVAFGYIDSYAQSGVWEPVTINALALEELELQLNRQEVMAVRFRMYDGPPTDTATYPVGSGRGPDVLGITVEVATKTGAPKGPAGQKA
jgi:hypothetical protein